MKSESGFSRLLITLLLLAAAAAGLSYFIFTKQSPGVTVQLATAERSPLVSHLTTNGKVEPIDSHELHALTSGMITRILVKEGDHVKSGQLLMDLDRSEASADLARNEAELNSAEADLRNIQQGGSAAENVELEGLIQKARNEKDEAARQLGISQRLVAKDAAPRAELDAAKERAHRADLDLAYLESRRTKRYSTGDTDRVKARIAEVHASLKLAHERLDSTVVSSPIAGVVYSLPVTRGTFANRGDLLAKVADVTKLRVKAYIDEPELGRVALGQEAIVTWDAAAAESWKGTVNRLPAEIALLGTRNVGYVECSIDNSNGKLLPNVNVNVEIVAHRNEHALTIPKEALTTESAGAGKTKHFVFVYANGQVTRHSVNIGVTTPTRVEIIDGITEGRQLAFSLDHKLTDGMKVIPEAAGAKP